MLCMSLLICVAAAIFQIKPLKGGSKERKRKEEEETKRRSVVKMATEDEIKMMITEKARSIEAQNFLASQLRKEEKDRLSKDDMLKEVARLNEFREDKPTPPEKPESEAGTDLSSDEDEKEEKKDEKKDEKRKKEESSSDGESSSSDEKEKKEDFKKTAEGLQQEAVMKSRMEDLAEMKEDAESRRAKVAEAANKEAEKAEETNEEAAVEKAKETDEEAAVEKAKETDEEAVEKAKETDEEAAERAKDKEERQRWKDEFDIYTQSIWPVIICDMKEDPKLVEKALPSQEMERQFSMLREITLKPVSALPDGYGLQVRDLKDKVEESVMEADESLSVLKEKLEKKQGMIKEAQDEYESAKASVETVEAAKAASEHFGSLLANTEICLKEMKEAFPELERLYGRPDENVSKQRKTLSDIMMKMRERKREDAASSAAGTPVPKEEKKPQAKKMPEDIKRKHETLKNYEEKQELLK
eukprot:s122_g22.t2